MQNTMDKTIKELARECKTVEDVHTMLKNLFKDTLQQIFEAEMDEHLGYKKHSRGAIIPVTAAMATAKKPSRPSRAKPKSKYLGIAMENLNPGL